MTAIAKNEPSQIAINKVIEKLSKFGSIEKYPEVKGKYYLFNKKILIHFDYAIQKSKVNYRCVSDHNFITSTGIIIIKTFYPVYCLNLCNTLSIGLVF